VRRILVDFLPGLRVEFTDRDKALGRVEEWAAKGTRFPVVIFGPEGCGKTAFLKQAAAALREFGYEVLYLNPLEREFLVEVDDVDIKTLFFDFIRQTFSDEMWGRVVFGALDLVRELLKRRKKKRWRFSPTTYFKPLGSTRRRCT
jgi:energy-coupling factor transporter ATP-binding protein EcfA2